MLLPLQGVSCISLIPRALPWAKSFCPFRACCCGLLVLQGVLLWAFGSSGRAAVDFLSFLGVLLLWALNTLTPFCTIEIILHALKGQKLLAQGNALGYFGSQPGAL